jgi:hypothetical protein
MQQQHNSNRTTIIHELRSSNVDKYRNLNGISKSSSTTATEVKPTAICSSSTTAEGETPMLKKISSTLTTPSYGPQQRQTTGLTPAAALKRKLNAICSSRTRATGEKP